MGERQFGPYRLVRQIAVGGMAEIHLAKTKGIAGFEKYVALKMIHPNFAEDEQFIQMLVDEAKIAVQLAHGNIAQTFDLGRVGETYYITMEYVDGADLYKVLRRASERDLELPLDVCAFIGKEIASALDHAHRKRDHTGKPLGIVHRDVSPQNVLLSYAGEVKLVDFGIAKATMKARQTAVGVIKGKYYYMSPEQAWGDPIDARSDIFSAGIVLYEMITGQMLYLEEDLQKLLDMARRADIAPPSRLRKGVPPQLERIVMHALAKTPGDRYESAGDFATDLERFLHAYSPVFTAGKIAALLREVVGDPVTIPPTVEDRGGPMATSTLDQSQVIQTRDEIRDENSVIFRVDELKPKGPPASAARPAPKPASAPRVTRATDAPPPVVKLTNRPPPERPKMQVGKIPSLTKPSAKPAARPRDASEHTRQLDAPPMPDHGLDDLSNIVTTHGAKPSAAWDQADTHDTNPGSTDVGERTMISAPGAHGFMLDAGEDSVDATVITGMPQHDPGTDVEGTVAPDDGSLDDATVASPGLGDDDETQDRDPDDDGPTLSRDFVAARPKPPPRRAPAPPALAAKIHAPAVSEIRKPRQSRRTPPDGNPVIPNVLQQIVGAQANEPMPTPRPVLVQPPPPQQAPFAQPPQPFAQPQPAWPPQQPSAYGDTPHASMMPQPSPPSAARTAGLAAMMPQHGYLPQPPPYPYPPTYPSASQPQHVTPNSLYPFHPPQQHPLSLTGQLRLAEVDEMPSHYKLSANKNWLKYVIAGTLALGLAAGTTILVMSSSEPARPTVGSVRIESVPLGADIIFDGTRLAQKTPYTVTDVEIAKPHEVRIELPKHKPYVETLNLAPTGAESRVLALLKLNTGTLIVNSTPSGAEVRIDDQIRGRTPTTIPEIDMASAGRLELRLKDHEPYFQDLKWPESGELKIEAKLRR